MEGKGANVRNAFTGLVVAALFLLHPAPAEAVRHPCASTAVTSGTRGQGGGGERGAGAGAKPQGKPGATEEAEETEAEKEQRKRREAKEREEEGEPHTRFVKRILVDGVVGFENRYRRPVAGLGVHLAFLKVGSFFIGAPGIMLGAAPEWTDERVLRDGRTVRETALKRQATLFLTQTVSWQVRARDYGYLYVSFVATKRLPVLDSKWDPGFAISFTPR
jgi:hypothetical protein